jgi:nucleoside-diphosphate-sugar epimerase
MAAGAGGDFGARRELSLARHAGHGVTPAKRVLVTGAGGFIGRWSVPALQRLGYDVHAVLSQRANRTRAENDTLPENRGVPEQLLGAQIHYANLLENSSMDALVREVRPTHLLHFAWIATPGLYWDSEENFLWAAASERLLLSFLAQGGRRVMMAGSCAEYDWSRVDVCDELTSPLADQSADPVSAYAQCKLALQRTLAEVGRKDHLSTAWGRIFFQFGPYEHPDRLVPSVIRNLLLNREALCSHGRQVRSFLHVADVGAAFAAVLDGDLEGPVNIGSEQRVTVAELVQRIARQIGREDLLRMGARPLSAREPMLLVPAVHLLRDQARWRPRLALDEALSATIDWWRRRLSAEAADSRRAGDLGNHDRVGER